jgi:hypothetical protein
VTLRALVPFALAAVLFVPSRARAHCDTLDGPVVNAARTALETGKLAPVLAWVQPGEEAEIRDAFAKTQAVRGAGKEARELADRWFFETVVRVHRAGEGAPFTGLKPPGTPEPAVAAADRVIAGGDAKQLEALLVGAVREGLHGHLARLKQERAPGDDVAAGRRFVAAYVPFVHWAEGVHAAAGAAGHGAAHGGHGAGHASGDAAATSHAAGNAGPAERGAAAHGKGHAH